MGYVVSICHNHYQLYPHICIQKQRRNEDERHSSLEKYTSHFIRKGCVWDRVGDWTKTAKYWSPSFSGHSSESFSFSWVAQPEARESSSLLCAVLSTASFLQLIWSRIDLISNWLEIPVNKVILLFYAHSISSHNWPTKYATLEWHVWSSSSGNNCHEVTCHLLPVHQFVIAPCDFNLVPYYQPSSPTQSLPITGQWNMQLPPSLEWLVWPCRRLIYNSYFYSNTSLKKKKQW